MQIQQHLTEMHSGDPPQQTFSYDSYMDARRGYFFWPCCNVDRPEYSSISHVHVCTSTGMLYGELARFVFRLLGIRTKSQNAQLPQPNGLPGPHNFLCRQNHIEGPKVAPSGASHIDGPKVAWDGMRGYEPGN